MAPRSHRLSCCHLFSLEAASCHLLTAMQISSWGGRAKYVAQVLLALGLICTHDWHLNLELYNTTVHVLPLASLPVFSQAPERETCRTMITVKFPLMARYS